MTSLMQLVIPKEYPLVIFTGLAINIYAVGQAAAVTRKRAKIFPVEFLEKYFGEQHKKAMGQDIDALGYPDTGNGLYAQKLSYRDWYEFNVLQRIHLNNLEALPLCLTSLLAAGIYRPKQASIIGGLYIVFRILYGYFYKRKGSEHTGKLAGLGSILCSLANVGIFLYYGFKAWRG